MRRFGVLVLTLLLAGAGLAFLARSREPVTAAPPALPALVLADDFSGVELDSTSWVICSEGDFKEKAVDVRDARLRLRCGTVGTNDKTVKYLGVRSAKAFPVSSGTRVAADLDWNCKFNGSYLSAAIILAPAAVAGNPLTGPDWVRLEYVGVPPGKNGRLMVVSRTAGRERYLFMEGWPEKNREGRPLALQKTELVLKNGGGFEILENGQPIYTCVEPVIGFKSAHLYLQMSSHSNYPPRELFFDNIRWN
jgi:hypothetical protein